MNRRELVHLSVWVFFLSLIVIYGIASVLPEGQVHWQGLYAFFAVGFLTTLLIRAIPLHRMAPSWFLGVTSVVVAQISALIALTGGGQSPFFPFYLFVMILSGAYFTGIAFFIAIALTALGFSSHHLLQGLSTVDPEHLLALSVYTVAALVTRFLFRDLQTRSGKARAQTAQLQALYEASRLLHAESASGPIFERLLGVAQAATGARYAALRTFDQHGRLGQFYHFGLSDEEKEKLKDPPGDIGVLGAIRPHLPPLRLDDLTRHPQHAGFPTGHPSMKSLLGVPIVKGNVLLGKLYLTEKEGGSPFTEEDENLVVALAREAAVEIEKARLLERIQMMAETDGLTHLFNRRVFRERLEEEIRRATRYRHTFSILMQDVDDFKKVNDSHGHSVGDAALRGIAEAIRSNARASDICARYGGEEFAILLPETTKENAMEMAERFRSAVAAILLTTPKGDKVPLTISIGVASYPHNGDHPDTLIQAADAALYQAKRAGKNRSVASS